MTSGMLLALVPQPELYAARCHVAADTQRCMEGWQVFYDRPIPSGES